MINNDLKKCYALQGQRSQFEDYGEDDDEEDGSIWSEAGKLLSEGGTKDEEREMILAKTSDFDEEVIYPILKEELTPDQIEFLDQLCFELVCASSERYSMNY